MPSIASLHQPNVEAPPLSPFHRIAVPFLYTSVVKYRKPYRGKSAWWRKSIRPM